YKFFLQIPLKFSPQHADKIIGTCREQPGLSGEQSKRHRLTHAIATHFLAAGTVTAMMREQWDCLRLQEPQTTTASMAKEKSMAERQEETRQEKETRWAAQRAAHEKDQQGMQAARQ